MFSMTLSEKMVRSSMSGHVWHAWTHICSTPVAKRTPGTVQRRRKKRFLGLCLCSVSNRSTTQWATCHLLAGVRRSACNVNTFVQSYRPQAVALGFQLRSQPTATHWFFVRCSGKSYSLKERSSPRRRCPRHQHYGGLRCANEKAERRLNLQPQPRETLDDISAQQQQQQSAATR
jgi:hypothetical protein